MTDRTAPPLELQPSSIAEDLFPANNRPLQPSVFNSLSLYFFFLTARTRALHVMGAHYVDASQSAINNLSLPDPLVQSDIAAALPSDLLP